MKTFKTIEIIRHPPEAAFAAMRDYGGDIAALVDDIDEIVTESREDVTPNLVRIVNLWKANPAVLGPSGLASSVPTNMLEWTDYADWDRSRLLCEWRIKTHFAPDMINCGGTTSFEPAMAGRGTRVTVSGHLGVSGALGNKLGGVTSGVIDRGAETVAIAVLPGRFRKIIQALSRYLDGK